MSHDKFIGVGTFVHQCEIISDIFGQQAANEKLNTFVQTFGNVFDFPCVPCATFICMARPIHMCDILVSWVDKQQTRNRARLESPFVSLDTFTGVYDSFTRVT